MEKLDKDSLTRFQRFIFRINGYVHTRDVIRLGIKYPIYLLECSKHGFFEGTMTKIYFEKCPKCVVERI